MNMIECEKRYLRSQIGGRKKKQRATKYQREETAEEKGKSEK